MASNLVVLLKELGYKEICSYTCKYHVSELFNCNLKLSVSLFRILYVGRVVLLYNVDKLIKILVQYVASYGYSCNCWLSND